MKPGTLSLLTNGIGVIAGYGIGTAIVVKLKASKDLTPEDKKNHVSETIKNYNQNLIANSVIIGGTALGAGVIAKSSKLKRALDFAGSKIPQKFTNSLKTAMTNVKNTKYYKNLSRKITNSHNVLGKAKFGLTETGKFLSPIMDKFPKLGKLSMARKGALGLFLFTAANAFYVFNRMYTYKRGLIDQKYKDKAAIEKHTQSPLE